MKDKIEIIKGEKVVVSGECQGYGRRYCQRVLVDGGRQMLLSLGEIDNLIDTEHSVEEVQVGPIERRVIKPGEPTEEEIMKWIREGDPNHMRVVESAKKFDK